jgi:hypothetical protein
LSSNLIALALIGQMSRLGVTTGMVAVVNRVVVAACAGLVPVAAGVHSLAIPVAVGAVIGAGAFSLHERHHRRAREAYSPETVDRAAIFVPPAA